MDIFKMDDDGMNITSDFSFLSGTVNGSIEITFRVCLMLGL